MKLLRSIWEVHFGIYAGKYSTREAIMLIVMEFCLAVLCTMGLVVIYTILGSLLMIILKIVELAKSC